MGVAIFGPGQFLAILVYLALGVDLCPGSVVPLPMKPYGLRVEDSPDVADIQAMGSKGSTGKFPGKSGSYHPYARGSRKARTRRYWKRLARREGARACQEE